MHPPEENYKHFVFQLHHLINYIIKDLVHTTKLSYHGSVGTFDGPCFSNFINVDISASKDCKTHIKRLINSRA